MAKKQFKGIINVDVRDSRPDWEPYLPPKAREGAPNVLYIIFDDTGIAAWDCFGGMIEMPNLGRIAKKGIRFTQWHTTALCSPSRSCMLTGRNAHMNGMACIEEASNGFPGTNGVIPPENGTLAEILVENGYSAYCMGKWHVTPGNEDHMAASRRTWPLGRGFERFYGFMGGETNQWYPDLVQDNHSIDPPYRPDQGYHLSKDLVDKSIRFLEDGRQVSPDKPWFAYLSFGANHAPHHVWREWADKYKGRFDMGYEKYRETTLDKMKKMGIVPQNTELSALNPWPAPDVIPQADTVPPWDSLSDDQKRLFCRMAELYAGFSSYTDQELGRLLDYLEDTDQLENTVVVVMSDNGASGEGGPNGSVNENKFFNGWPDDLQANLAMLDKLGSTETYNHYPTGWACAFNTPYKMFKRYSLEGGVADPLIISWPKEMKSVAGDLRDQYHHVIDIVPTILDCAGIEPPEAIKGYTQSPIQGVSMRYAFASAKTPTRRDTQYYAMLGTRGIYHKGWKAVARHGALSGRGSFMQDKWELYHTDADRAETRDLSEQYREKTLEMAALWFSEAGRNNVLPLDDRTVPELFNTERPEPSKPRGSYVYYPDTAPVGESSAVKTRNRSFALSADLHIEREDAQGVVFAMGSRFGGHTLFIKDRKLFYVNNFLGIEEQKLVSGEDLPMGQIHCGVEFAKTHEAPKFVANGTCKLFINDRVAAEGQIRTQPGPFGKGLAVGRDAGDAVSREYQAPFAFTGGKIKQVIVNVSGEQVADMEKEAAMALSRD